VRDAGGDVGSFLSGVADLRLGQAEADELEACHREPEKEGEAESKLGSYLSRLSPLHDHSFSRVDF
jgi:hypothetical protein